MQVNITLIAQACNFFIAWFLLHRFYFKPAITALDARQKEHDSVLSQKDTWRDYVTTKQHEIHTCWRKLKHFARHHLPETPALDQSERVTAIEKAVAGTAPETPVVGSVHELLVKELKDKIIAEVLHVEL